MNIRNTTLADAPLLAASIDRVAKERSFLAITSGFPAEATESFIRHIQAVRGVHLVAEKEGDIIGWCDISPLPFEGMKHVGMLGMGVAKDFRSKGVGRSLLGSAIKHAFAAGLSRIELEVFSTNTGAIRLYEGLGFVPEGRKVGVRKLDGVTADILLYALRNNEILREGATGPRSF